MYKRCFLTFITTALIVILICPIGQAFGAVQAKPTSSIVLVDGKSIAFDSYNINDYNYFKLRDLAYALNGSGKQFAVDWNESKKAITLSPGSAYEPTGEEMTSKGTNVKQALLSDAAVYLSGNGGRLNLEAYNIDGYNYFKLRDVGIALDFGVGWDNEKNTITIDSGKGYNESQNTDLVASDNAFNAIRRQNMSGDVFYAAVTLTVPNGSPNFSIDRRPGPGGMYAVYSRDRSTLYYAEDYNTSGAPFTIPNTVSRIYDAALVNIIAPIALQDGNKNFIIENNMLLTRDRTRLISCVNRQVTVMEYKVPDTVTQMDTGAFYNMSVKTAGGAQASQPIRIILPEGLLEIPDGAFASGAAVPGNIPRSVKRIGDFAIAYDYKASRLSFTVPTNVSDIGYNALPLGKASVSVDEGNKWYSMESNILYNKDKTVLITGDTAAYYSGYQMPDTVKNILSNALFFNISPGRKVSVIIPQGIESMEENCIYAAMLGDGSEFTLYGRAGSCAETYAAAHGMAFMEVIKNA